jgi:5-methylthioadenosine/S-adenosylhomocysteine deaminase
LTKSERPSPVILVTGGRVYDHDGDVHMPPVADVLVADGLIVAVRPGIAADLAAGRPVAELAGRSVDEVLDAHDRLVLPGFVNAHYHSHDVLLKGCFETIPLEQWVLTALPPAFPKRSKAEIRARALLGAVECLRSGMTTVQDLATVYPYDAEHVDVLLQAYEDVGIRCVFALQVTDRPGVKAIPFWEEVVPPEMRDGLAGAVEPYGDGIDVGTLVRDLVLSARDRHPRITMAIGPTSPERCSDALLKSFAELSREHGVPVYTHLYESKAMTLIARQTHTEDGGSLVNFLDRCGLLNERTSMAHSVWMTPEEIDLIALRGANVVLNPIGNLKTRSGVAPIRGYMDAKVNVGLGCDNCSCGDAQNMFQAMKLFASLAAICDPEPGPPTAADAIRAATVGGARTAGLQDKIGALRPGMAADLTLIDLSDPSFVPLNSVARQVVFTESGRGVESVMVDGRIVLRDRKITTIDERALREEVAALMGPLRADLAVVLERNDRMLPYILEANRRTWAVDIGLNRYVGDAARAGF